MRATFSDQTRPVNGSAAGRLKSFPGRIVCAYAFLCLCFAVKAQIVEPNLLQDLENDLLLAKNPTTDSQRQLWKTRIRTFEETESTQNKDELKQLMQKINMIKFDRSEAKPRQAVLPDTKDNSKIAPSPAEAVISPVSQAEPNEAAVEMPKSTIPSEPPATDGAFSEQTTQMFQQMLEQPENVKNPFELAEILFRGNCLKEAAICYQTAYDRQGDIVKDPHQDKAWILFQLGNCLQKDNPEAALKNYRMLITEYPDCPWAELAKEKSKLVDWQMKDKPVELIHECRS